MKIRGSALKYVLKELMKDKLPPAVIRRKKEGFDIPAHHWFRTALRPLLLETLTREAVERTGIFQWSFVESLLKRHLKRRVNAGYQLWGLLTLFLWMKRWSIHSAPAVRRSDADLPLASLTN